MLSRKQAAINYQSLPISCQNLSLRDLPNRGLRLNCSRAYTVTTSTLPLDTDDPPLICGTAA